MKKAIPWLIASAIIMLAFPWLAVTLVNDGNGMMVCLFLFFVLNPVYVTIAGVHAGRNIKGQWDLPILTAVFFLAGAWLFFDAGEKVFILYASIYLVLGIVTMLISRPARKQD